jgi:hypothetical protein
MFRVYHWISLIVSCAAVLLFVSAALGPVRPSYDGQGPSVDAIAIFLLKNASIVALIHSWLVSIVYLARRQDREGKWGIGLNVCLVLLFWYPYASVAIRHAVEDARFKASPFYQARIALQKGTAAEFMAFWNRIPPDERSRTFIELAADNSRLDALQALKAAGVAIVGSKEEESWGALVSGAAYAENAKFASSKLATVEWLLAEGAPYRYSLRPASRWIFDAHGFSYRQNIGDPETVKLFELLIARGADPNKCDSAICPLWYATRFQKPAHVRFLLSHGTTVESVNRVDGSLHTTPLSEAIERGDGAIAGALLDAGAVITHGDFQDDVISACIERSSYPPDARRELTGTLKRHRAQLSKAQLASYRRQTLNDTERNCAREFLAD